MSRQLLKSKLIRNIALFATAFAMVVVVLGAFTRLSDAGLGCPDWPGCYGFMHIPTEQAHITVANEAFPDKPYQFEKAWPEMVHRYFAGTLGLLVLSLAVISWINRPKHAVKHSTLLLMLVILQAALGMWTVTMKLHPVIVMLHLMGGITTFSLLAALTVRYHFQFASPFSPENVKSLRPWVWLALVAVVLQVMLGGWTSANYAAMVCHELPVCQGNWLSDGNFAEAFHFWGKHAESYEYGILSQDVRIAIHAAHRIGAMVATVCLLLLIVKLLRQPTCDKRQLAGYGIAVLLLVQITLGVNNILSQLPLANAVAHNAVGALLVVTLVALLTMLLMPAKTSTEASANE